MLQLPELQKGIWCWSINTSVFGFYGGGVRMGPKKKVDNPSLVVNERGCAKFLCYSFWMADFCESFVSNLQSPSLKALYLSVMERVCYLPDLIRPSDFGICVIFQEVCFTSGWHIFIASLCYASFLCTPEGSVNHYKVQNTAYRGRSLRCSQQCCFRMFQDHWVCFHQALTRIASALHLNWDRIGISFP